MLRKKQPTAAFSLIELAIVLGVFSLIVGSLWALAGSAQDRTRREQILEQVVLTVNNLRAHYQGQAGFPAGPLTPAALTDQMIRRGVIPSEMVSNRGVCNPPCQYTASHPWGGGFQVGIGTVPSSFFVGVSGLTLADCIHVAPQITGTSKVAGFINTSVNGQPAATSFTVDQAQTACEAALPATITFLYRLR